MTYLERVPLTADKSEVAQALAELSGLRLQTGDAGRLDADLGTAVMRLRDPANVGFAFRDSRDLPEVVARTYFPAGEREAASPDHRNGVPTDCPSHGGTECSPAFTLLEVPGGAVVQVGRAPVVLLPARGCVVSDYSSGYARLLRAYDLDLPRVLADARRIEGAALVLCDDVWPLNYAHWLLDELPRLAFLGERRDVSVVVAGPVAGYRRETLLRCGFAPEQIVAVADFAAVRADRLLVSRDVHGMPHPAFKGAWWALDFLRSRLGPGVAGTPPVRKIYVSRGDSRGRYVVNEDALMSRLQLLGYERVSLGLRTVAEQAALFAGASHVVGLHGAGLANLAFARAGTQVVELFPVGYGTPTFYVVAAAVGCRYASYVGRGEVVEQGRDQIYDARLDLDHFFVACRDLL